MERTVHQITDEAQWHALRTADLTSTDIAALFGMSPYLTRFELWHRKHDRSQAGIQETERMTWGKRLEAAAAEGIAEDNGWKAQPLKDYRRLPEHRLGSSFDWLITEPFTAILEIKNVDFFQFKDGWEWEGDSLVAPAHIELQVQHQMLIAGIDRAYIGALVGGNRAVLLHRDADTAVHRAILDEAADFWASVGRGVAPTPEYPGDAAAVCAMYPHSDPAKIIEDPSLEDIILEYRAAAEEIKAAEDRKSTAKARLLERIGDAGKAKCGLFTISAGLIKETAVSYTRKSYRDFRITARKAK